MDIYRNPPSAWSPAALRVVLVTGLSNPQCCCLHPQLSAFLRRMAMAEDQKVYRNFPFVSCAESRDGLDRHEKTCQLEVPLWRASWANLSQYAVQFRRASVMRQALVHWVNLRQATERLLVIAASCGVELVRKLEEMTPTALGQFDLRVLALGAVTRRWGLEQSMSIQGQRDWVSRWFPVPRDCIVPDVGHMDYWTNETIQELANQWLVDNTSA